MCDAGLAASANVVGVSLGGILGHCMCTGGAVLGGRQMAAYVAERTLAVIFFFIFWLRAAALASCHDCWKVQTFLFLSNHLLKGSTF